MSRARLGLYVFGRAALFGNCYELRPTFRCAGAIVPLGGAGRLVASWLRMTRQGGRGCSYR